MLYNDNNQPDGQSKGSGVSGILAMFLDCSNVGFLLICFVLNLYEVGVLGKYCTSHIGRV